MPVKVSCEPSLNNIPVPLASDTVIALEFSRDGSFLAVASRSVIDIWNMDPDPPQFVISHYFDETTSLCLAWFIDQCALLLGDANGGVSFVALPDSSRPLFAQRRACFQYPIRSLSLSDDRVLAVATDAAIGFWEVALDQHRFLGQISLPDDLLAIEGAISHITWVSKQEIALCYANVVV
ncbi:hypothetical protein VKT23_020022 [Stygiomarasmius scandens]|uniref:Uncharacterized protein n=1 Tax=Marasmiellus scandens TaxID=2682957 RepID=A0ABR1IMN0_9AGAR